MLLFGATSLLSCAHYNAFGASEVNTVMHNTAVMIAIQGRSHVAESCKKGTFS